MYTERRAEGNVWEELIRMVEKLSVRNFRGLENVEINPAPFTLIGGENNVGKTSVLEALFLLYGHRSPIVFQQLLSFRNASLAATEAREIWENMFYGYDSNNPLSVAVVRDDNNERLEIGRDNDFIFEGDLSQRGSDMKMSTNVLGFSYPLKVLYGYGDKKTQFHYIINTEIAGAQILSRGNNINISNLPVVTLSGDRLQNMARLYDLLGVINRNKQRDKAVNVLKDIDGRINDIVLGEKQQIYLDVSGLSEMLPLTFMGKGIFNILYWTALIISNSTKIILLDEIENGIHFAAMQSVMERLCDIGERHDCQIIATTHSIDCVRSFSKCRNDRIKYIRLERSPGTGLITPVEIEPQLLPDMLEAGWEVR
jgi:AAA15 family ATPase/GTPase